MNRKKKSGKIVLIVVPIIVVLIALSVFILIYDSAPTVDDIKKEKVRVSFDIAYDTSNPETQVLNKGDYAIEPVIEGRDGYSFIGWYIAEGASLPFDFSQPIRQNTSLKAKWYDQNDTVDSDGDGITDSVETELGTDINNWDTDNDGLADGVEVKLLNLDPLSEDTDADGIPDSDGDRDRDGLTNILETEHGTSPMFSDTDSDGLSDFDEIDAYGTDPLYADTDGDEVTDQLEISLGSDPLAKETLFTTSRNSGDGDSPVPLTIEVTAITDAQGAGTLNIEELDASNGIRFSECAAGYLGNAYEISTDGNLQTAEITFSYDDSYDDAYFQPRIYWYSEEEDELIELENQVVNNGTITAQTDHFSTYVLRDKSVIDSIREVLLYHGAGNDEDGNGDGISDFHAELINDGKILYDNSYFLVGVLDIFGMDDDDWDDDGLKNGEEIEVKLSVIGLPKISINSNPLLVDSDNDGIDDYSEVKTLGTPPLMYDRKSVGALNHLLNHSQYSYSSYVEDWRDNVALFLEWNKYDKAKKCLIDYFYDYAPEETIEKNQEKIKQRAMWGEAVKCISVTSNLISAAKSVYSVIDTGTTLADLKDPYNQSIELKKDLLVALNKDAAAQVKSELVISELSMLKFPEKLGDFVNNLQSDDAVKKIEGAVNVINVASSALKIYEKEQHYKIFSLTKQFSDFEKAMNSLGRKKMSFSTKMTIVNDGVDMVKGVIELNDTYSKLLANADAYNMYMELLLFIRDNAEDDYVRNASGDIARDVLDTTVMSFYIDLSGAVCREMFFDAAKTALDAFADAHPIGAILKTFVDLLPLTGISNLSQADINFSVMSEISIGCVRLLNQYIQIHEQTFSYSEDYSAEVEKYLVQLAQSRIVGEYFWYEYLADNSGAGFIQSIISGKQPDEYRQDYKKMVKSTYDYANRLQLKLSPNLPYYSDYAKNVPEDEITGLPVAAITHDAEESVYGTIQGGVFDADSDYEIADAEIDIYSEEGEFLRTVNSDENGEFALMIKAGIYSLDVIKAGYLIQTISNVQVESDETNDIGWIALVPESRNLDDYTYEYESENAQWEENITEADEVPEGTYTCYSFGFIKNTFTFYGDHQVTMSALGVIGEGTYEIRNGEITIYYTTNLSSTKWRWSEAFEIGDDCVFIGDDWFYKE